MQLILFVPTNVASALEHGKTVSTVPASGSVAGGKRHVICSSVTKSLRDAASVCIASDALQQSQHQNMPAAGSVA